MSETVRTADFEYDLPEELIAQHPLPGRDQSRLMALDRATGRIAHHVFSELPGLLREGDVLVANDTAVLPAKFFMGRRTGGRIEGLFLRELSLGAWEVLLKGADRCKIGEELQFHGENAKATLKENLGQGAWRIELSQPATAVDLLGRVGQTPLPPYIRRRGSEEDRQDRLSYQTVYARAPGAVAAPTAGLHFTPTLLQALRARGIETACVTLHVGVGTFAPVKAEFPAEHRMHAEWYDLPTGAAEAIVAARAAGRRIVAVGTTTVRVLETVAAAGPIRACRGWTDIFIYPPATFRAVDAMITNFHLPRSTLLMLAAAFCAPGRTDGVGMILSAYAQAVRRRYRFYSYGDAMLIQ